MFSVVKLSIRSFNLFIKALSRSCLKILWNILFQNDGLLQTPTGNTQPLKENNEYNYYSPLTCSKFIPSFLSVRQAKVNFHEMQNVSMKTITIKHWKSGTCHVGH